MVIEYGQHHGAMPFAFCVENTDSCLVKIQVPEAVNMGYFEGAYLPALAPKGGLPLPLSRLGRPVCF